jgi:hypothetical protein
LVAYSIRRAADDPIEQHKKAMVAAISNNKPEEVKKLVKSIYIDVNTDVDPGGFTCIARPV